MDHKHIVRGLAFLLLATGAMLGNNESRPLARIGPESLPGLQQRPRTVSPGEQRRFVLSGHKKQVNVLAFSPNGLVLATGSDDKTVKLWETSSGRLLITLTGHDGGVYDLRFSPDGEILASVSEDKKPRLWNVSSGQLLATLIGHNGKIYNLEFSPDGQMIVTGSGDGTARLWDVATGKQRATLKAAKYGSLWKRGISGDIDDLFVFPNGYFSPDGKTVLTISGDRTPKLWDSATGQLKATLDHEKGAAIARFSPDGRWIATESSDDKVRLWETSTGQLRMVFAGHKGTIYDTSFSPDGRTLVTGSLDRTAILWDVTTGDVKYRLDGFDGRVPRVAFSRDGKFLAAKGGFKEHVVKLWNVSTGELLFTFPLPGRKDDIEEIAFSPDGLELMVFSDKLVRLWNTRSGEVVATLEDAREPAVFRPDGNQVAARGPDNSAILWDLPAR